MSTTRAPLVDVSETWLLLGETVGQARKAYRSWLEGETYLARATAVEGVEIERLASSRRDRATVRAREAVVLVALERYRLRCRDLAVALGRSADQVSRWAGQASRRKAHDGGFRCRLDALDVAVGTRASDA